LFLSAALPFCSGRLDAPGALALFKELSAAPSPKKAQEMERAMLWAWILLRPLAGTPAAGSAAASSPVANSPLPGWIEEWMLTDILGGWLARSGWDAAASGAAPALFSLLLALPEKAARMDWAKVFSRPDAERLFGVHSFEGVRWFRKEALEAFTAAAVIVWKSRGSRPPKTQGVLDAAAAAGYRWEEFLKDPLAPAP
jgi:hypothetical protein